MRDAWERLRHAWHAFQARWADVQTQWHDPVAERFHRDFIEPWRPIVESVLRELDRLETELTEAEEDFGD